MQTRQHSGLGGTETVLAPVLFMAQFLYMWVTVDPYVEISVSIAGSGASSLINQLAAMSLFCLSIIFITQSPVKALVLQPRGFMIVLLLWLIVTTVYAVIPQTSIKQLILVCITLVNASVFLLLPRSEEQFARLICAGLLIMLGFAYFGVFFKPLQGIHQFSTELGNDQVGDWRGHFAHKNVAAGAMLMSSCYGLYLKDKGLRFSGWLIVILSVYFLIHTGGKTSTAMLPAILIIAFVFEKFGLLRWPIALGGALTINFLTVGAALLPPVYKFIESLGVDPSFTNRADIWRFAAQVISERPFFGYGLQGFWRSDVVVNNDTVENWAPLAFNGHNAWVDALINLGAIGFILMIIWVLVLPLIYVNRIFKQKKYTPVVRLYIRIWLYGLFSCSLESMFFENGSLLWFSVVVAICGLRLQAVAEPVTEMKTETTGSCVNTLSQVAVVR